MNKFNDVDTQWNIPTSTLSRKDLDALLLQVLATKISDEELEAQFRQLVANGEVIINDDDGEV